MKAISNRASTVVPPVTAGQARPEKINLYSAKWLTVLVSAAAIRVWISRGFIVFGAQFFQLKDVSLAMAGSVLTLFLLATALGTFFGGIITDMIGTKKMMVISFVLASVCTLMMLMGKGYLTVIAFLLVGFFISTSNSSNIVIAHDIMPGNVTFATGMIMGLAGGVGGIGIYITGTMADSVGLIKATAFLMVPLLLMSVLNFLLPQTASSKNIKEVDVI
jgi:FSR family fosmidomycin resistance protein-like MFS transporter